MPEQPRERLTQNRVVSLFTDITNPDCLGYRYLGERGIRLNTELVKKLGSSGTGEKETVGRIIGSKGPLLSGLY